MFRPEDVQYDCTFVSPLQTIQEVFGQDKTVNPSITDLLPLALPQLRKRPRTLLVPFLLCDPHVLIIGHDVGQNGPTEEDHVSSARRVFYPHLELA